MKEKYSPMMMQYLGIKEQNKDSIVMFRLGDFYEMFFDDAIMVSKELELALTGKNAGAKERVPMCGVPFHSASGYIQRLVDNGHKVAIVEQLTDPGKKGIVERGVVQIVTPGTIFDESLTQNRNNYIACMMTFDFVYTLAFCDITTGEFQVVNIDKQDNILNNQLATMEIKEIVVESNCTYSFHEGIMVSRYDNETFNEKYQDIFKNIKDLKQIKVATLLLNYLIETQKRDLEHLQIIEEINNKDYMTMDLYTKKSLELTENARDHEKYGSLFWLLDMTKSAMGARLLKNYIDRPLLNRQAIEKRLDIVEIFTQQFIQRESIKEILKEVYDLERLSSRIAFGNINARDLKWIASSLKVLPELKQQLYSFNEDLTNQLADQLIDLSHITKLIDDAIIDNPPLTIKEGNIIKDHFSEDLDELRYLRDHGKQWLIDFEQKEREKTGIKNLKVGYNRVFGYYIEVTKGSLDQVKDEFEYTRKQSLSNAERFITPELKDMESKILSAQDKIEKLEYVLFTQIRNEIKKEVHLIQDIAKIIAQVDVYQSLAMLASENSYVRPIFNNNKTLEITEGRHGVIEKVMGHGQYVPNDVSIDEKNPVVLITGPNMGGKSTYMREVALMIIMAQIGSFVPAKYANLTIFDQIFTRIGASDDLISGQSTFMVEMLEANNALRYANENSLILFDEIGRGTATFDGMAIAQAMIEYIAKNIHCMTLFSTHYHELTFLEDKGLGIQNVHASARVDNDHLVFEYLIKKGKSNKSYGVNVAKLAKLPDEVIQRANRVLETLEENNVEDRLVEEKVTIIEKESEVEKYLKTIDPMALSPLDALSTLIELKKLLK
ncbi:DNA mismatch repair protein MutS [Faecalibacillus faecis]|uniref:DNA mismatch repair protein MutS n=1 Tax=Faecalibacillus faecis TaxID=1982628 RepID=UPI0018AB4F83|nr:DNA mismatch repair protein MutS [Faecalibacillus faecis]